MGGSQGLVRDAAVVSILSGERLRKKAWICCRRPGQLTAWWMLSLSRITTITGARGNVSASVPGRTMKSTAQRSSPAGVRLAQDKVGRLQAW